MIAVEYLVHFPAEKGICRDRNSLLHFIQSNNLFRISGGNILYRSSKYKLTIQDVTFDAKKNVSFHIILETRRQTETFRQMLRHFRKTIYAARSENLQIIWDGVSKDWAIELYPKIYVVENLMRKLITKFMVQNLGLKWPSNATPKEVKDSSRRNSSTNEPSTSFLYDCDFIELSSFLFKKYSHKDVQWLINNIESIAEISDSGKFKEKMESLIPKNNWDRYFSELMEIDSESLKDKWRQLYEIRCKVAHNKPLNIQEYENGKMLTDELSKVITDSIGSLEEINIPDVEKEDAALHTIANRDEATSELVNTITREVQPASSKNAFFKNVKQLKEMTALMKLTYNNEAFRSKLTAMDYAHSKAKWNAMSLSSKASAMRVAEQFAAIQSKLKDDLISGSLQPFGANLTAGKLGGLEPKSHRFLSQFSVETPSNVQNEEE